MRWPQLLSVALLLAAGPAPAAPPRQGCVVIQAVAPYAGAGYNHVASTENQCERPVRCELWTDVDPAPHHVVALEPHANQDITFRREAPGHEFRVYFRCRYR